MIARLCAIIHKKRKINIIKNILFKTMKKVFCILSIFTLVSPAFADVVAGTPTHADPATLAIDGNNATINPGYALVSAHTNDTNAASAGYVKGAYNAAIKAVNTVASLKQDTISVSQGTGSIVTGVSLNNDGKTVTVTKSYEATVPVSSSSSSTRANIWVE